MGPTAYDPGSKIDEMMNFRFGYSDGKILVLIKLLVKFSFWLKWW